MNSVNFITPMQGWNFTSLSGISKNSAHLKSTQDAVAAGQTNQTQDTEKSSGSNLFTDTFKSAIDNVKSTQAEVEQKQYELATGQLDDAHSLPIAEAKAQVSLDMMIALRNKAMESYNEIMKMSV